MTVEDPEAVSIRFELLDVQVGGVPSTMTLPLRGFAIEGGQCYVLHGVGGKVRRGASFPIERLKAIHAEFRPS
jgi:hypothetical protein